jgi:tRNA (Thr-GGU) A37 N-methylase
MFVTFEPIGFIHSPFRFAAGTPIQPRAAEGTEGTVEVVPSLADGLKDLDGPYLEDAPHGVFATRARTAQSDWDVGGSFATSL